MKPIFMRQPKNSQANRSVMEMAETGTGYAPLLTQDTDIPGNSSDKKKNSLDKNFNRIYIFGSKINPIPET